MRRCVRLLAQTSPCALIVLFSFQAAAQQASPPPERLEEINVVATSVPTPNDQTGSSVTVVTAEQIQQTQRRTAAEVLRMVPGVNVVQTGVFGGQTSVFMRGSASNHVKVLVDGIDVSDPSNPNNAFDFGQLLVGDMERIEILRGPQSGLYGSDAIGGVISLTTKKGEGPLKIQATTEGGSFGTLNSAVRVSGSQEQVNYSFNVQRMGISAQPVTPPILIPPTGRYNNNSSNTVTFSGKVGAQLTDIFGVNLTGRYTDLQLHYDNDDFNRKWGPEGSTPADVLGYAHSKERYVRGEVTAKFLDGRFQNWFGVSDMTINRWSKSGDSTVLSAKSNGFNAPLEYLGYRTKFDWRGEFELLQGHKLIGGLEHQRDAYNQPVLVYTQKPVGAAVSNDGGYLEYVGNFADRFFMNANIREDNNYAFGWHTTYRVAPAVHVPWTETVLKASYGTGFKAPSLYELYVSPSTTFLANPLLQPEKTQGYDIGLEQPIMDDRYRFGLTHFRNRTGNLITTQTSALTGITQYVNIQAAKVYGYEVFAQARVTDELTLRADYTYTVARDTSPIAWTAAAILTEQRRQIAEGTDHPELLRRPKRKATLQATWKPTDKLTLTVSVVRTGSWVDVPRDLSGMFNSRLIAPGATVVNVAGSYDLAPGVTATARVDNIGNAQYQNPLGYRAPGLSAIGGLRLTY